MIRFVYRDIVEWKKGKNRKPLLIRGARQVGKTWLVQTLAKSEFDHFIKIDFEQSPQYKPIFDEDLSPERVCSEIELISGVPIVEGRTLLFFDEVQECPRALMSMRYFFEQKPGLHLVAAGSLLEFVFNQISFPVGRISIIEVTPLSFPEYLLAIGNEKASVICRSPVRKISDSIHEYLMGQLKTYFLLGGMPETIKIYTENKSLKQAIKSQWEIINSYKLDFNKYSPKVNVDCLNSVLTGVASQVGRQLKYVTLATDFTIPTIKKAFEGLGMSRIIIQVKSVNNPGIPFEIYASTKKFKALFVDIGLMNSLMGLNYSAVIESKNILSIYRGQLAEQFAGQEFISASSTKQYYWSRDAKSSNAEVDYIINLSGSVTPVEVKDGPSGKLRSLHLYRKQYNPTQAVVLHSGKLGQISEENILFLPLYFAWSLAKHGLESA